MCIQRLRYAQEKQLALAKQDRREVAQLLSNNKEQKAHYRVESLINDDIHIELLEILELYCELLLARVAILNAVTNEMELISSHMEDGINEAVRALVYSTLYAPEIKELTQLRDLLTLKFGKEFLSVIIEDKVGVPDKVTVKCSPNLPQEELVVLYLKEIARTYDVSYSQLSDTEESEEVSLIDDTSDGNVEKGECSTDNHSDDTHDSDTGGAKEPNKLEKKPIVAIDNEDIVDPNSKHPITVKKPRQNSDTVRQKLKIPKSMEKDVKIIHSKKKTEDDELMDLKKRFEALRR